MKIRSLLLVSAMALMLGPAASACAQTQPAASTTGPTPSGPGGATAPTVDRDVDLPVEAPVLGSQKPTPPPPPDSPPPTTTESPPTFYGKDLKSETGSVYFVIDISGSMAWDEQPFTKPDGSTGLGCRLDRAKVQLTKAIASLPKTFKFDLLAYDCSVYIWQSSMMPADDANKAQATAWVNDLRPQGGTGTGPAVLQALQVRENKLIVLLTDGGPNCGAGDGKWDAACFEAHREMISGANSQHAVINVFGICANEAMMKTFCQEVAADSGGSYTDVP